MRFLKYCLIIFCLTVLSVSAQKKIISSFFQDTISSDFSLIHSAAIYNRCCEILFNLREKIIDMSLNSGMTNDNFVTNVQLSLADTAPKLGFNANEGVHTDGVLNLYIDETSFGDGATGVICEISTDNLARPHLYTEINDVTLTLELIYDRLIDSSEVKISQSLYANIYSYTSNSFNTPYEFSRKNLISNKCPR